MAETIKTLTDATWPTLKAKAGEMGIAPPATPSTWAKVHDEIKGFAARAAAKVAAPVVAAPAVITSPAPAPAPAPQPTGDADAARATALGKADIFALRQTAGATSAAKKNPKVDPLPPGCSISGQLVFVQGGASSTPVPYGGYDWRGFCLYQNQDFPVDLTDAVLGYDPDHPINPILYQGPMTPAARWSMKNVTFDMWRNVPKPNSWIINALPPVVSGDSIKVVRLAAGFANIGPGCDWYFSNFHCEAPGQNPYRPGFVDGVAWTATDDGTWDHPEVFNQSGGVFRLERFFYDGKTTNPLGNPGCGTGWGLLQPRDNPLTNPAMSATFSRGLVLTGAGFDSDYNFQVGGPYPARGLFNDVALRKPARGNPGQFTLGVPWLSLTNVVDFDTGAAVSGGL